MHNDSTLLIEAPIGSLTVHNRGNLIFIKSTVNKITINGNFNTINLQKSGKINSIIYNGNNNRLILNNNRLIDSINITDHGINNQSSNSNYNEQNSHNSNNLRNQQHLNNLLNNINNIRNINNNVRELNTLFSLMHNNINNQQRNNNNNNNSSDSDSDDSESSGEKEKINKAKLRERLILELDEFQFKNVRKFVNKDGKNLDDTCSICLEKFDSIDIIKELPCEHIFHKKCLLKWLNKSDLCPLCKNDLNVELEKQKKELQKKIK